MKITESKLRQIIREVIAESDDHLNLMHDSLCDSLAYYVSTQHEFAGLEDSEDRDDQLKFRKYKLKVKNPHFEDPRGSEFPSFNKETHRNILNGILKDSEKSLSDFLEQAKEVVKREGDIYEVIEDFSRELRF